MLSFELCRSVSISCDGEWRQASQGKKKGGPKGVGPTVLIYHIRPIAPTTPLPPPTCIANTQTLSAIDHLRCPICLEILSQLPCRAVLCAACIMRWLTFSTCTRCPRDSTRPSTHQSCLQVDPGDIIVSCSLCKVEMKAGTLDQHQCSPLPKTVAREELQTTASVIQQLLSQNMVELPTKGTDSQPHTHTHTHTHTLSLSLLEFTHSLNVLATDPG